MARDDNPTHTRLLSQEIDGAYQAYVAGAPDGSERLYKAFRAQARNVVVFRLELDDPCLEHDIAELAMRALANFRGGSRISTWFYRIAQNEAKDALRERIKARETMVSMTPADDDEPMPLEAKPDKREPLLDVDKLQRSLSPKQAEVINLVREGYSLEQVAAKTGNRLGTVRSRYERAKDKMRAAQRLE